MLADELKELKSITKQIEDADVSLLKQSQQWKYAFDAMPDAIFITNENFDIKFANKAFVKRFNTTIDELLTTKCHQLVHNIEQPNECVCKGADGEAKCYGEVYSSRTNRWYLFDRAPINDSTTNLLGHINILRDITEEKASTEARLCVEGQFKKVDEKYKELVQFMGSGVAVYEAIDNGNDFIIKDWNRAAEFIEKLDRKDVVGRKVTDVFPSVKSFGLLEVMHDVWLTGKPVHHPLSVYVDEQSSGWRDNFVYRLSTGEVVAIYDDVTEKKVAEEKIFAQEKLFSDIIESILAGYWDWDLKNNTEYLSPTFKQMFGYADNELENSPDVWQKLILPEDLPSTFEVFNAHVNSRGEVPYYNEVRYRHKNGNIVWVMCVGRVIEWGYNEEPIRMIGCHVDITKLKEAEHELKDSYERVKNELRIKLNSLIRSPNEIKILVIDDEVGIRTVIEHILEHEGYQIVTAESGRKALDLYHSEQPDLVIADLRLPDMSGQKVIKEINDISKGSVPIIIISGSSYISDIAEAFEGCNCDYIMKPIAREVLLTRVKRNLLNRELFNQKKLVYSFLNL